LTWLEFGVIAGALLAMVSILVGVLRSGISPMPSSRRAREAVLQLAEPEGPGPIFELGCGWGGLAVALARTHPERQVVGYEISLLPWAFSSLRARLEGLENLRIVRQDFLEVDLSVGALLVCFLYPKGMQQLAGRLEGKFPVVVSNTFALPGWQQDAALELGDRYCTRVYRYRTPQLNPS